MIPLIAYLDHIIDHLTAHGKRSVGFVIGSLDYAELVHHFDRVVVPSGGIYDPKRPGPDCMYQGIPVYIGPDYYGVTVLSEYRSYTGVTTRLEPDA